MTTSKKAALSLIDKIAKANGIHVMFIASAGLKKPAHYSPFMIPVAPINIVAMAARSGLISLN